MSLPELIDDERLAALWQRMHDLVRDTEYAARNRSLTADDARTTYVRFRDFAVRFALRSSFFPAP